MLNRYHEFDSRLNRAIAKVPRTVHVVKEQPLLNVGDVLESHYRIERIVGQGGMGTVFLATDLRTRDSVALKVLKNPADGDTLDPKSIERFRDEARILSSLAHENVARVLDFFDCDRTPVLVMEFIPGRTLDDAVQQDGRLSEHVTLTYAQQLLDVLDYLHSQKPPVVIRDLNPRNVMLREDGQIVVIDFGIARALEPGKGTQTAIRGVGTEGYAPLEQYGRDSTDERTDIYSLGATLYFCLTGTVPPEAASRFARKSLLRDIRTINETVSSNTVAVIEQMMSLAPQDRPQSIRAVVEALSDAASTKALPCAQRGADPKRTLGFSLKLIGSVGLLVVVCGLPSWQNSKATVPVSVAALATAQESAENWVQPTWAGTFAGAVVDCDVSGNRVGSVTIRERNGDLKFFTFGYDRATFPNGVPSPQDVAVIDVTITTGVDGRVLTLDRHDSKTPATTVAGFSIDGVRPGQVAEEVVQKLGAPSDVLSPDGEQVWRNGDIKVKIESGMVVSVVGTSLQVGNGDIVIEKDTPFQVVKNKLGEPGRVLEGEGSSKGSFSASFDIPGAPILSLRDNLAGERWVSGSTSVQGTPTLAWIDFADRKVTRIKLYK